MDWFLYDRDHGHARFNSFLTSALLYFNVFHYIPLKYLLAIFSRAYPRPLQRSKTESFSTIVNGIEMLTIVRSLSIVDLSGGSGYNSATEIEALNGLISWFWNLLFYRFTTLHDCVKFFHGTRLWFSMHHFWQRVCHMVSFFDHPTKKPSKAFLINHTFLLPLYRSPTIRNNSFH